MRRYILNGLIKYDCIPVEYNTPRFTFSNLVEYNLLKVGIDSSLDCSINQSDI